MIPFSLMDFVICCSFHLEVNRFIKSYSIFCLPLQKFTFSVQILQPSCIKLSLSLSLFSYTYIVYPQVSARMTFLSTHYIYDLFSHPRFRPQNFEKARRFMYLCAAIIRKKIALFLCPATIYPQSISLVG